MDRTILKVKKYIEDNNLINSGDKIVVGVSGGADSVCLLSILNELKNIFNFTLKVVHINHLIRKDALEDAVFVEKLCDNLDIPFYYYEKDIEKMAKELHISCEDAGRRFRYQAFNEIAKKDGKIAVAHNRNDKVETFFFNLFRGSGINGLCSIKVKRDNIIRPILCLDRIEIEDYLNRKGLTFKIDSTNATTLYTRNKIRNKVIPYVKEEIHSNVVGNVSNTIEIMEEVNEFFNELVDDFCNKNVSFYNEYISIDLEIFNLQKNIIKRLVLLKAIEYFVPDRKDISSKNILDIIDICTKNGKKEIQLLNNLKAVKNYGILYIHKETIIPKIEVFEKTETYLKTSDGNFVLEVIDADKINFEEILNFRDDNIKFFDLDKIDLNHLSVDFVYDSAYIYINNSNKPKKLKDYFNSEKIKGNVPVFSCDDNVLWVVGHRISDYYKVTKDSKKILKIRKEIFGENK